jgi:hypothetical protein
MVAIKKEEKLVSVPVDISVDPTIFNAASRSPSTGTANTTPPIQHSPESSPGSAGSRNKMNINSLLDAAAAIDRKGSKSSGKRKFEATSEYTKQGLKKIRSLDGFEDEKCNSWDLVEKNFHIHVAKFLDDIFATSRFGEMQILGLAHSCGLPMDGNGTVVIPANSGGTTARSDPSYNSTFTVGQQIATLEAVRQMLLVLCPKFNLDNLSIDEGSVGKLEELRIGNDYRLLRAVFQLITADNTTLFLPVSEKDEHLLTRIQSLYQFVTKRDVDAKLEDPDVRRDLANRPTIGNAHERIVKLFSQKLTDYSNEQIWELLTLIATMTENTTKDEIQLSAEQEKQFLQFVKNSRHHQLHIPLLLSGNFYLSVRRPVSQDLIGLHDYFKQQLIESTTSLNSNVVTRRLISMVLN